MNKTSADIETIFAGIRKSREKRIGSIASERGCDPFVAGIIYDTELAPLTTNAKMLELVGVNPDTRHADLSDGAVATRVSEIAEGLAVWAIYLVNTDHLTDRELLDRLDGVLSDRVRLVVPDNLSEFVDLSPKEPTPPVTERILPRPVRP